MNMALWIVIGLAVLLIGAVLLTISNSADQLQTKVDRGIGTSAREGNSPLE